MDKNNITLEFSPKAQQRATGLINQSLTNHIMGLLLGQSGSGKTFVCEKAKKDSRVVKIKMRMNLSASGIVDKIISCGSYKSKINGNINKRFNSLVRNLKEQGIKLIIIDEADMFCIDSKEHFIKKFEILRELYESGFSVILVGLNRLSTRLKEIGEDYISRRVKLSYTMVLTKTDIEDYYNFLGLPECSEKTAIVERAYKNGNFGIVKNIYDQYKIFGDIRLANELVFTTQSDSK